MNNNNILLLPARQPGGLGEREKREFAQTGKLGEQDSPAALISAPASKSISHRMLIAAGLAQGQTVLNGVLASQDTAATSEILQACGALIQPASNCPNRLVVQGVGGQVQGGSAKPVLCNANESGTTARLLSAVLAAGQGLFEVTGAPRMQERPMQGLIDALVPLGAKFEFKKRVGYLPFILQSQGLSGQEVEVDTSETSQYLSGLLLAAPLTEGLSLIPVARKKHAGADSCGDLDAGEIVSWPYALLSLQILHDFGLSFKTEIRPNRQSSWQACAWQQVSHPKSGCLRIQVPAGKYQAGCYQVEGDYSNASYFLAAGAIGCRPVRVDNLRQNSLQGDKAILDILSKMGARLEFGENAVTVFPSKLRGIEVNMADCPDLVPTVAVLAAFAQGATKITGVEHLRIKESDRIAAPAQELAKLGCKSEQLSDGLIILPPARLSPPAQAFATYNDHRMAMSMALFSCAGFNVQIENPGCVAKSFPNFWQQWAKI